MDEVKKLLQDPLILQGLRIVAPEIAIGIDLVSSVFGISRRRRSAEQVLAIVDKRLAEALRELATTKSKFRRNECEIRAHELLGVLNDWQRVR